MIRRREFITLLGGAAAWPLPARGQQADGRAMTLLLRILQLRADSTAERIAQIINEVIGQIGWTTQLPWSVGTMDQRRFDALRLLRQARAVAQFAVLDPSGKEQLRVSRIMLDVVDQRTDFSQDPKFTEAVAHGVYYGPVGLFHPRPIQPPARLVARCESDQGNTREIGAIEGLGVVITDENGEIKVVAPIDNMPAAKAGIMAGDIIVALDDEAVHGLTLSQAAAKMRGPVNTGIKLTILRGGRDPPIEFSLIRAVIRQGAAVTRCLPEPAAVQPTPFVTLSLAGARRESGVSVAEVNLQRVMDVIQQLKVGEHGVAYVLDAQDGVIAHSDMFRPIFATDGSPIDGDFSLFQRDFSSLAQVRAAHAADAGSVPQAVQAARDIRGDEVLAAFASVAVLGLGWHVFVELPIAEADTAVP
jgi:hypothetical protein